MRRKLFTLAAGVSAVLCVAVCVLWVRGYWVADYWFWFPPNPQPEDSSAVGRYIAASELGVIHLHIDPIFPAYPAEIANAGFARSKPDDTRPPFLQSRFGYYVADGWSGERTRV